MLAHQVAVELYTAQNAAFDVGATTRMFHRWIQQRAFDEQLIDVVSYAHVAGGPGVLLVGCEGQLGLRDAGGRLALSYRRRCDEPGPLGDRLRESLRRAVAAAHLLARARDGAWRFRGDELRVRVHSRLLAPNTPATFATARLDIEAVTAALFPDASPTLEHDARPEQLFTVTVRIPEAPPLATLADRLG